MRYLTWLLLLVSTLSFSQTTDKIVTESTSSSQVNSTTTSINETTVNSPPPTATSPPITIISNDLCTVGVSGAVQTQILGVSGGSTVRDLNCERLKLAKNLYDMGMKVAAVSTLCQDPRVFSAMMDAGTPCPIEGKIGEQARQLWEQNPDKKPKPLEATTNESFWKKFSFGLGSAILLLLLL
jgi:hypothetical protein